ncbi:MAG: sugar O-acyltransferase, sialic acid O-acetyltransferase NeuD family [Rhodocyclales bacterium]|nr:sugar O-acyltransferase, sialic acid O-acetyltransferase NeuD family [Rhodocyclales bacterium]
MKDLVIVGVGGHGRELLQCVAAINAYASLWNVLGFVDDNIESKQVGGHPVLGTTAWLKGRDCSVVVAIGASAMRRKVVHSLEKIGVRRFATLVHPSAQIGTDVIVGDGSMISAGAVLTTNVTVGRHVIVNTAAIVSHDCRLADFATLAPNVCLCGAVRLEEGVELGASSTLVPGVLVGAWSLVGAGATVIGNVPPNETVAGVPARTICARAAGWQDENDE